MTDVTPIPKLGRKRKNHRRMPGEVADAVIERSKGRCEAGVAHDCNGRGQHLHHRLPRSAGGEHSVDNILHACRPCHDAIHAHPVVSYALGHLIRRST